MGWSEEDFKSYQKREQKGKITKGKSIQHINLGMGFEGLIEHANSQYLKKGLATIQKVHTPWVVVRKGKQIISAYPKGKSTVDFVGMSHGRGISFDCKSTRETKRFPLDNVHQHQMDFLKTWQDQGGISFFLVEWVKHNEIYYVPYNFVDQYWQEAQNGGRKSIPYEDMAFNLMPCNQDRGVILDYLKWALK